MQALDLYTTSRVAALKDLYDHHITLHKQNVTKEEVAASMTYFSFSLEEFAREILDVIHVLNDLKEYKQTPHQREWKWLAFWSRKGVSRPKSLLIAERSRRPSQFPIPMPKYKETPPKPSTKRGALKYRIWKGLEKLRKPEIKFAVKVGVGAALLASPAFTERWRDLYSRWRGEWALLSYFVVIASSVGGTTSTGLWRLSKGFSI